MKNMLGNTVAAAAGLSVLMLGLNSDGSRALAQAMKPLLVQVVNTSTEPIPVVSHVERIVLEMLPFPSDGDCPYGHSVRRVLADGTFVQPFTVPPGKMLVLTDLQGIVLKQSVWNVGEIATVSARADSSLPGVAIRASAPVNADAALSNIVSVSAHLQSGGIIGPNLPVCVDTGVVFEGGAVRTARLQEARLHGYLIAE